jgi:hypothetical protein
MSKTIEITRTGRVLTEPIIEDIPENDSIITCTGINIEVPAVDIPNDSTATLVEVQEITTEEQETFSAIIPLPVNQKFLEMNLFPNPANTFAVLEVEFAEGFYYTIYDLSGAVILNGRSNSKTLQLDVSVLTPATYLCVAREGDRAKTLKLVISR